MIWIRVMRKLKSVYRAKLLKFLKEKSYYLFCIAPRL